MRSGVAWSLGSLMALLLVAGCQSASHTEEGALCGGLGGAGLGAIAGHAMGNTAAGAMVGTGVGAVSGAVVGSALDKVDAKNQAFMEQQLGHTTTATACTIDDVIAMQQAGVSEELIINHVRAHRMVRQLQAADIIRLQQRGVGNRIIAALQEPDRPQQKTVIVQQSRPVVLDPYGHPYPYPPYDDHEVWVGVRPGPCPPGVGFGMTFRD